LCAALALASCVSAGTEHLLISGARGSRGVLRQIDENVSALSADMTAHGLCSAAGAARRHSPHPVAPGSCAEQAALPLNLSEPGGGGGCDAEVGGVALQSTCSLEWPFRGGLRAQPASQCLPGTGSCDTLCGASVSSGRAPSSSTSGPSQDLTEGGAGAAVVAGVHGGCAGLISHVGGLTRADDTEAADSHRGQAVVHGKLLSRDAFPLHTLNNHPIAPVLLRMLQLNSCAPLRGNATSVRGANHGAPGAMDLYESRAL